MNRRRSGLGSGLDALFSSQPQEEGRAALRDVAIGDVRPNLRQPRTQFDQAALEELAASIREHGLIQPLIVSSAGEGYEIIAGERRWRAAQLAGLTSVPVIVREAAAQQVLELALIENVQRADLNPLEEARAYQSLVDDFGLTDGEIARRMGKGSREAIANMRRLLQLDTEAQEAVLASRISAGHGRAILKLKDAGLQRALLGAIQGEDLSVRAAERLADLIVKHSGDLTAALGELRGAAGTSAPRQVSKPPAAPSSASISADDDAARRTLEQQLGTPVTFARTGKELRITIAFHSDEKLQEFFELVNRG
jgi:ParB family transcriptional regulator, chromosome partitioning protein